MRYRRRWLGYLLFFSFALSKASAAESNTEIESALSRAGENRPQIQAALDKAPADKQEGMRFLIAHMPDRDLRKLSSDFLLENVDYVYRALNESPWKADVPKDVFLNYLLPYASIDERRDNWRKDFYERFKPLVAGIDSSGKAGATLNQKIFPLLKVRFSADRPKANQSPYETIEANRASCTGLSVLLIDACRAVGVPARLVGTPLWTDNSGNHSWVEIWDAGDWHFTGAAEPSGDALDQGWFAGRATTALRDDVRHAIYAARYEKSPITFPSAWSRRQEPIYAVNVTDRYTKRKVKRADGQIVVRFRMFDKSDGPRTAARLRLLDSEGKPVAEGITRDDRFDPNDHLEAVVTKGAPLRAEIRASDKRLDAEIQPNRDEELFTYFLTAAKTQSLPRDRIDPEEKTFADSESGKQVAALLTQYFAAAPEKRSEITFDPALDKLVLDESSAVRKLAWKAYLAGHEVRQFQEELNDHRVAHGQYTCPYVVRAVGPMPENGWPLFIAMHGGGGAPPEVNDSQWRAMQHYYRDQSSVEGYLYLAIRAPNDTWNGFYSPYNLSLTDRLIRQFVAGAKVDPNKVFIMGYSHGGYGAFYLGPRMADRFAAVHVSAAAPSEGNAVGVNLRNTPFTFMIGEQDTAHNRLSLCRDFDSFISGVRGERNDIYPVKMEFKEGAPHSGLPDRDKIKEMYSATRNPVPREVTWLRTHPEISDFYWLHLDGPPTGQRIDGTCRDNVLTVNGKDIDRLSVLLDERLVDYSKPLTIDIAGDRSTQSVEPSLRTLCETLANRCDPETMFATRWTTKSAARHSE